MRISNLFGSYLQLANPWYCYVANTSSRPSVPTANWTYSASAIYYWRIQTSPATWRDWFTKSTPNYRPWAEHSQHVEGTLLTGSTIDWTPIAPEFDWNNLPESLRSTLVSLMQLPTVTSLAIHAFNGFTATALSGCGNLTDFEIEEVNFNSF